MKCLDERILSSDSSSDTLHNTNTKPTSVERDSLGSPPKHGPATRSPSGLNRSGRSPQPLLLDSKPENVIFFAWKFRTYGYPTTPIFPRPFFLGVKFGGDFFRKLPTHLWGCCFFVGTCLMPPIHHGSHDIAMLCHDTVPGRNPKQPPGMH